MSASPSAPSPYIAAATASPLDLDLPAGWLQERLCNVTELRTSNVDKKSADGEQAVKLCNYVDVYYHDKIRSEIAFMDATATTAQIENFTLRKGDVVMTKDSETPDDIGIPALVDFANHALLVLELVNGVLELLIEDAAVGDDDDRVEDFFVGLVVQTRKTVR